jgi:lysophospholipase L1-like esterase
VSETIRRQAHDTGDLLVDLAGCFGQPPEPDMLQPDGLHPTLAGHQAITRTVIQQLARQN